MITRHTMLPANTLVQHEVKASPSSIPSEHEMMVYQVMADQAVESKMYRGIGDKAGVMMIMLAARELGIPPMQALNKGLNIIQGAVEISARMMNAMIRRAGHSIKIIKSDDITCTLEGKRSDNGDTATVTYGIEDAKKAGLVKVGGGWTKNPTDMCFARALSRLARQLFSDVIGIGYVEGEITQAVQQEPQLVEDAEVIDEQQEMQDSATWFAKYLEHFDQDDKTIALEYLEVVRKHFEWSAIKAVMELLKDEQKLKEKFQSWKSKNKKSE